MCCFIQDPVGIKNLDAIKPDWGVLEWSKYIYIPMGKRVAIPNMARGCPFTCSFCSQWKFWRQYRTRDPKKFVDEVETLAAELATDLAQDSTVLLDERDAEVVARIESALGGDPRWSVASATRGDIAPGEQALANRLMNPKPPNARDE